jgi:hypothetical protein
MGKFLVSSDVRAIPTSLISCSVGRRPDFSRAGKLNENFLSRFGSVQLFYDLKTKRPGAAA